MFRRVSNVQNISNPGRGQLKVESVAVCSVIEACGGG